MKKRIVLLIILFLPFTTIGHSFDSKLPKGYRYPKKSDYTEDELSYLKNNLPFKIEADFDGNGKVDTALLLIQEDNSGWSLFVFMKSANDQIKELKLDDTKHNLPYLYMGISMLEPGEIKTACGKGYWECERGEPATLNLKYPGIDYFVFESANSIFYWDKDLKRFNRVWLSD